VAVFTQPLAHRVRPVAHEALHVPPEQDVPAGQALPQAPQFAASVAVFTQLEPQRVDPGAHPQAPFVQPLPAGHTLPQAPQLRGSLATFVQAPPQRVAPALHPQAPLLQA
jgi:hypothetical protein